MSEVAGVSRDTIRFYERHGLIASAPEPGATNTYRAYPDDAVMTLEVIRDAQDAGMSIADVSVFLGQLATMDVDFDGDAFLAEKIVEVETRLGRATRFLQTLKQTGTALARAPYSDDKG